MIDIAHGISILNERFDSRVSIAALPTIFYLRSNHGILDNISKVEIDLHESLQDKVLNRVQQLRLHIKEDVGDFLHNLDHRTHTEDQVRAAVNLCLESLMGQNEEGRSPIQVAVRNCFSHAFVPLLAELATEHKQDVGGPDKQGGLLIEDSFVRKTLTVLEIFVCVGHRDDPSFDADSLETLKKLKTKELLHIADIRRYKLLLRPNSGCQSRIEFLADWNPQALDMCPTRGCYPIFLVISKDVSRFKMMLKAGVKHFPNELGFLFTKNAGGDTACKKAIKRFGKDKILDIIQAVIPSSDDLPILHFVMRSVPHLLNDFALRYPSATYLRDNKGRQLHHVAMAREGLCATMQCPTFK